MTDGLRKSHLRKAPQVGLSEVELPDIYQRSATSISNGIAVINQLYVLIVLSSPIPSDGHLLDSTELLAYPAGGFGKIRLIRSLRPKRTNFTLNQSKKINSAIISFV